MSLDYVDRSEYVYTTGPGDPIEYDPVYPEPLQGIPWVTAILKLFIFHPAIMIIGLLLLIGIAGSKRVRNEPWRWLIAHTALVSFFLSLLELAYNPRYYFNVPSLASTPLCPAVHVGLSILSKMYHISLTLVAIERFRALKYNKGDEGGMGRKAVILSLSLFWLFVVISTAVGIMVSCFVFHKPLVEYRYMAPDVKSCNMRFEMISAIVDLIIILFMLLTMLVVIIGISVLACKRTITQEMKQSIVIPTLLYMVIFVLSPLLIFLPSPLRFLMELGFIPVCAFPLVWLITWSINGDITWRRVCQCGPVENGEVGILLEPK